MKAHLMFKDKDFDIEQEPPFGKDMLVSDLELNTVFSAMAREDKVIMEAVQTALLCSLKNSDEIRYRQSVLKDCIKNQAAVRKLYALTIETFERKRKEHWWYSTQYLSSLFSSAVSLLQMLIGMLKKLRGIADESIQSFESSGFVTLFSMLQKELDDDYFSLVNQHLNELKFREGTLISARLGHYNQGVAYVLRRKQKKCFWRRWAFAPSFIIASRDDRGAADLSARRDRAINEGANAVAQSADHVLDFFNALRNELAFYVGCLNLYNQLQQTNLPTCIPEIAAAGESCREFKGLYDISLTLMLKKPVIGNSLLADNQSLFIITGANQGGKTTFLRSIGQSQLMMQCGMFVPADSLKAHISNGIYTHFIKEEDAQMKSGKLDEELERMSRIADHIKKGALMLFNESFSSTNEREGSEISRQIVSALKDHGIEVFYVTHLFEFANGYFGQHLSDVTFLRAERLKNGTRTFRIMPGKPLESGFGEDLYQKIFGIRE